MQNAFIYIYDALDDANSPCTARVLLLWTLLALVQRNSPRRELESWHMFDAAESFIMLQMSVLLQERGGSARVWRESSVPGSWSRTVRVRDHGRTNLQYTRFR